MRRLLLILSTIAVLYLASYAVLRWRKVLVMHDYYEKGHPDVAYQWIGAGHDFRDDWRGIAKSLIGEPATVIYFPLIWIESTARGGQRVPAYTP